MINGKIEMFVEDDSIELYTLRQGDILSNIQLLGAINLNSIQYTMAAQNQSDMVAWSVSVPPRNGDAIVLSHSCEIALENKLKVTSIILAPLRDIHKATAKDKVDELIGSNLIDQTNPEASYLKYFYLSPNKNLEFKDGAVVDFSKIFSVRKNSYNILLQRKVAQLTESAMTSMALKLSLYFHRNGA